MSETIRDFSGRHVCRAAWLIGAQGRVERRVTVLQAEDRRAGGFRSRDVVKATVAAVVATAVLPMAAAESAAEPAAEPATAKGTAPVTSGSSCVATWSEMPVAELGTNDNLMYSIDGTSPTNLYATGRWDPDSHGAFSPRLLRNAGAGWTDLPLPVLGEPSGITSLRAQLTSVAVSGTDQAWAGGTEYDPDFVFEPVLLRVLGSTVSRVALPPPPAGFQEANADVGTPVASAGGSDLWAAVSYYPTDFIGPHRSILYRPAAGGGWSQTVLPTEMVTDIAALSTTTAYIGGQGLFRWHAGEVRSVTLPGNPAQIADVAVRGPANVWALGRSPLTRDNTLARFDGTQWSSVSLPPDVDVTQIDVAPNGALWATGTTVVPVPYGRYSNWVGRYDPRSRSWVDGLGSISGWQSGGPSDLLAVGDGAVYVAGWARYQRTAVISRMCRMRLLPTALIPSTVWVRLPGEVVLVKAADLLPAPAAVSDTTGFLNTGSLEPGQFGRLDPYAAATYRLTSTAGGGAGAVKVPLLSHHDLNPRAFRVYVATRTAPTGYAYQLQLQDAGATTWRTVPIDPDGIAATINTRGTYAARSRVRNLTTGATTDWSPVLTFTRR